MYIAVVSSLSLSQIKSDTFSFYLTFSDKYTAIRKKKLMFVYT